jgi:hypothetical protein
MTASVDSLRRHRRGGLPWPAAAALITYAAFAAALQPFSHPQRVVTALAIALVVGVAVVRGWAGGELAASCEARTGPIPSFAVWAGLLALSGLVQLHHYLNWPRDVYPTLSSLAGEAFAFYPARALGYGLWLWLAWYLLDR